MKCHTLILLSAAFLPQLSALPTPNTSSVDPSPVGPSHQAEAHPLLARELRNLVRSVSAPPHPISPGLSIRGGDVCVLLLTSPRTQLEDQLGIAAGAVSSMDVATILNLLAARDDDLLFRRQPKTAGAA